MNAATTPSLLDLPGIVLRHKWKVTSFFVGTVAFVALVTWLSDRKYVSEAQLFVRMGRESVGLDATATVGETASVYESRENEILSVLDVIRSRVLVERVVDTMGPQLTEKDLTNLVERENLIRDLDEQIEVTRNRNSSVIAVRAVSKNPELSREIVKAYLAAFQERHLQVNRTEGSFEFFVAQEARLRAELEKATIKLRDAKNAAGLASIQGRQDVLQQQFQTVEADLLTTQAALAASGATIEALRGTLSTLPEKLTVDGAGFPDDATSDVRRQLYTLQLRANELASRYSDDYPLLRTIRGQAKEAEEILASRESVQTQSSNPANPARQQLYLKLLDEEAIRASLQAKESSLQTQQAEINRRLHLLNDQEGTIASLQQDVDVLIASHRTYTEKLEQVRIERALEDERISNVNIFQPPSFVAKPVSPRVTLNLALGILFGTFGGIALAFVSETYQFARQPRSRVPAESGLPTAAVLSLQ